MPRGHRNRRELCALRLGGQTDAGRRRPAGGMPSRLVQCCASMTASTNNDVVLIRRYDAADWPLVWAILEPVFRAGETYAFPREISAEQARDTWTAPGKQVFVAADETTGDLLGTYYLKPNFQGAA